MPKPLTDAEFMLARTKAKRMAKRIGKPVSLIRNRLWDVLWNGPARAVEAPGMDDDVLVREIQPTSWTPEMSAVYAKVRAEAPEASAALDRLTRVLAFDGDAPISADARIEVLNALVDHLVSEQQG